MALTELNHYFVRAKNLERSRSFYCDALGFEVMPRPNFPFPQTACACGRLPLEPGAQSQARPAGEQSRTRSPLFGDHPHGESSAEHAAAFV